MILVVRVVPGMDLGMGFRSGMVGIGILMRIVIDLMCFTMMLADSSQVCRGNTACKHVDFTYGDRHTR